MGGFVDPFIPAPAWPQDMVFAGSSWSGSAPSLAAADSAAAAYQHGPSPPALLTKGTDVALHEQFLQLQGEAPARGLEDFGLDGAPGSVLGAPRATISLADSGPVVCSSNDDSSGSEQSGLPPQFLLGEPPAAAWASTLAQISSLVGEDASRSFGFGGIGNDGLLRESPQQGNVALAPLQLHDDAEFNTGKMLSFTPAQQAVNTSFDDLQISQKELSGLHHLNLASLVSGQLSSFNATAAGSRNPKQPNEVSSGLNGVTATFVTRSDAPNGNGNAGNGVPKPRVRARRGQATDPHSIAERLRREKISDRMKNLQELVPNSNKTDKASMLDEIIDYVKFLQLQVKVLSMSRLGATEAVVPLLTESQSESSGGLLLSPTSGRQQAAEGGLLGQPEARDGPAAFEQEVVQLMENNMTTAMSKGLCLMPIALASAISEQKGTAAAAVRPESDGDAGGDERRDAKETLRALAHLGGPMEMKSRA